MKKTCMNCIYYCGCLSDDSSNYHIHDYCKRFGESLSNFVSSELNRDLGELCNYTSQLIIYNDVEIGDACCYMFQPKNPMVSDELFNRNKVYNIETLLKCIDELLNAYDEDNEENNPYSKEYLQRLKLKYEGKIKG